MPIPQNIDSLPLEQVAASLMGATPAEVPAYAAALQRRSGIALNLNFPVRAQPDLVRQSYQRAMSRGTFYSARVTCPAVVANFSALNLSLNPVSGGVVANGFRAFIKSLSFETAATYFLSQTLPTGAPTTNQNASYNNLILPGQLRRQPPEWLAANGNVNGQPILNLLTGQSGAALPSASLQQATFVSAASNQRWERLDGGPLYIIELPPLVPPNTITIPGVAIWSATIAVNTAFAVAVEWWEELGTDP